MISTAPDQAENRELYLVLLPELREVRLQDGLQLGLARQRPQAGLCTDEGALSFVTFICCHNRDCTYKRE